MPRIVACAVVRSFELYTLADIELASMELQFTPLFKD